MNMPARDTMLFKWTCPHCKVSIRTRNYDFTRREAIAHSWNEHRLQAVGLPTACMWDMRLKHHLVLYTFDR